MDQKREEIKVGSLIIVAIILFLSALVFVGGINLFRKKKDDYKIYFKFAGGIEPGSYVRFGGLKVGTVKEAKIDPEDSTRIRVKIEVNGRTPIRANSKARISSLGLLGENYLEVSAGTRDAALLPPGSEIPSMEMVQLAEVVNNVNMVATGANKLMNDLDDKFMMLSDNANQLVNNLKAVVGPENRQHIEAALANVDALLAETRPQIKKSVDNFETATEKLGPTIDKANGAITRADTLIENFNTIALENRAAIHTSLLSLRDSLKDARRVMGDLDDALVGNRENLDEILENLRLSSQNLRQFTDTIKQRPFSLIRIKAEKDRLPPSVK